MQDVEVIWSARIPTSKSSVGYRPNQTVLTHHAPCLAHEIKGPPKGPSLATLILLSR